MRLDLDNDVLDAARDFPRESVRSTAANQALRGNARDCRYCRFKILEPLSTCIWSIS